jgi:transcriptional regulator with XRE-family HTH domain
MREIRLERGWDQIELGKRMGLNQSHISQWERGVKFPRPRQIPKLAKIFRMNHEQVRLMLEETYRRGQANRAAKAARAAHTDKAHNCATV